MLERLREKIFDTLHEIDETNIGIAFSGGIDSSLLAKASKEVGKKIKLLTVSFSDTKDIMISTEVSRSLDLEVYDNVASLVELENALKIVLSTVEFDRLPSFEICLCFYFVFQLATRHGIHTVLSANGLDELFCGYHVYTSSFVDNNAIVYLMNDLVETARKDKFETDKLSKLFGIRYLCPFLSESFVDFAMKIPVQFKITSTHDKLRKQILREVALSVGLPKSVAFRPKKAFQYSSGIHKAIRKLAKSRGFTKREVQMKGYRSEIEAYIKNLQHQ
jgi:asparagine synthase (glutamine-hydrolysing)